MVSLAIFANTFLPSANRSAFGNNRRYSASDKSDEQHEKCEKQRLTNRQLSPTSGMSLLLSSDDLRGGQKSSDLLMDFASCHGSDLEEDPLGGSCDTAELIRGTNGPDLQGMSRLDKSGMTIEHRQAVSAMLID